MNPPILEPREPPVCPNSARVSLIKESRKLRGPNYSVRIRSLPGFDPMGMVDPIEAGPLMDGSDHE